VPDAQHILILLAQSEQIRVLHALANETGAVTVQFPIKLGVCFGNGDGTFRAGSLLSILSTLTSLVVRDVNNDGHPVCQLTHATVLLSRDSPKSIQFFVPLYIHIYINIYIYVIVCFT
jgi:hypothetical protein